MAANGISTLSTKALKQVAKLAIAQAKKQGKTVALDGTISGSEDSTKSYYRTLRISDINLLPTKYDGNALVDNRKGTATGIVPNPDVSSILNGSFTSLPPAPIPNYAIPGSDVVVNVTWGPNGASYYSPRFDIVNGGTNLVAGGSMATSTQFTVPFVDMGITGGGNWTLWVASTGLQQGRPWTAVPLGVVDTLGFFEQQLDGGTYMTFDESISGVTVKAITTNFNGNPTNGSYIKINGVLIAGDRFGTAPDGTNTVPAPFLMTRGHTITILDPATGLSRSGFPKCYDTYGGAGLAAPGTAGIANDMKNAAAGDIIVMGTYDATSVSAAMRSAMNTYTGSTSTNTWSAVRISHMFLAKRNTTP